MKIAEATEKSLVGESGILLQLVVVKAMVIPFVTSGPLASGIGTFRIRLPCGHGARPHDG